MSSTDLRQKRILFLWKRLEEPACGLGLPGETLSLHE